MSIFTRFFSSSQQQDIPREGVYLGNGMTLLESPEKLKQAKIARISEILGDFRFTRPNLSECDINDLKSIFAFIAKENLECSTNDACGDSSHVSVREVEKLCKIILGQLGKREYVHVTIHPNYQKAMHEDRKLPIDLLPYFQVGILPLPQDEIQGSNIDEFKRQYRMALYLLSQQQGSSHQ